jgi:hypothetical protein
MKAFGVMLDLLAGLMLRPAHCILVLVLSGWACRLPAEEYSAEGEITYSTGTNHVPLFTRSFQVVVSNCTWSIRVTVTQETDPTPVKRFEVVYDGQSIYYYKYLGIPAGSPVVNKGVAEIDDGPIPYENASFANYIWLGLASACVFREAGEARRQPPWSLRDAQAKPLAVEVVLAAGAPRLPERIVYQEPAGVRPAPFDKGWRAGELRVLAWTNDGNLSLPQAFVFEKFKPRRGASKAEELVSQYQVAVGIRSIGLPVMAAITPPENEGATVILDRRLAVAGGVSGITYLATNGSLPRSPDALARREQEKLTQIQRLSTADPTLSPLPRRVAILCLILSIGVGALIVVRQMKSKSN